MLMIKFLRLTLKLIVIKIIRICNIKIGYKNLIQNKIDKFKKNQQESFQFLTFSIYQKKNFLQKYFVVKI